MARARSCQIFTGCRYTERRMHHCGRISRTRRGASGGSRTPALADQYPPLLPLSYRGIYPSSGYVVGFWLSLHAVAARWSRTNRIALGRIYRSTGKATGGLGNPGGLCMILCGSAFILALRWCYYIMQIRLLSMSSTINKHQTLSQFRKFMQFSSPSYAP